jgi:hydrogenase nickel incorporation protein HypA/HybF
LTVHEASLARQIVATVVALAEREHVSRVRVVRGWISDVERLSAESLALHFAAGAAHTAAAGARLELELRRVDARCRSCGARYAPEDHHLLVCPSCGGTGADLLGEVGLGIDAIEVE